MRQWLGTGRSMKTPKVKGDSCVLKLEVVRTNFGWYAEVRMKDPTDNTIMVWSDDCGIYDPEGVIRIHDGLVEKLNETLPWVIV